MAPTAASPTAIKNKICVTKLAKLQQAINIYIVTDLEAAGIFSQINLPLHLCALLII